jgi:hypothetical protein
MQRLLEFIEQKKQGYAQLPLFAFMQDQTIPPLQRLGFAPCMAHFIMSFGDLNKYVFREKEIAHQLHGLINEHTYENDRQWALFLMDLKKLGFCKPQDFTEVLRFLWGEETQVTRQLSYQLSAYTLQAQPIQKLAIIKAIEATGNVLFELTARIALEIQSKTQQEYQYFGKFHLELDAEQAIEALNSEGALKNIELSEEILQECFKLIEEVFSMFAEWTEELHHYARRHSVYTLSQLIYSGHFSKTTFGRWRATE